MKRRVVLSFILSLVFLTSCGVPNWFYISSADARISNSGTLNSYTTISVNSKYDLNVDVFLLYTITNATETTTPTESQIKNGLRSAFRTRYRINDANSNRFSSNNLSSVAEFEYASTEQQFNLYALRPNGENVPTNTGNMTMSSPNFPTVLKKIRLMWICLAVPTKIMPSARAIICAPATVIAANISLSRLNWRD